MSGELQPRNELGQYVSLEKYVLTVMDTRLETLKQQFDHTAKALELQAKEYERRLDALNHAHERALAVQHTFVSIDKYEDKMESEAEARKIALERLDEKIASLDQILTGKLDDYITKYEARQREIDSAISTQKGAAQEAQRAAEEQGRKSNRNMAIVTIVLTVIIAVSQWLGTGAQP